MIPVKSSVRSPYSITTFVTAEVRSSAAIVVGTVVDCPYTLLHMAYSSVTSHYAVRHPVAKDLTGGYSVVLASSTQSPWSLVVSQATSSSFSITYPVVGAVVSPAGVQVSNAIAFVWSSSISQSLHNTYAITFPVHNHVSSLYYAEVASHIVSPWSILFPSVTSARISYSLRHHVLGGLAINTGLPLVVNPYFIPSPKVTLLQAITPLDTVLYVSGALLRYHSKISPTSSRILLAISDGVHREYVRVIVDQGHRLTVVRCEEGKTQAAFAIGAEVSAVVTAGALEMLDSDIGWADAMIAQAHPSHSNTATQLNILDLVEDTTLPNPYNDTTYMLGKGLPILEIPPFFRIMVTRNFRITLHLPDFSLANTTVNYRFIVAGAYKPTMHILNHLGGVLTNMRTTNQYYKSIRYDARTGILSLK